MTCHWNSQGKDSENGPHVYLLVNFDNWTPIYSALLLCLWIISISKLCVRIAFPLHRSSVPYPVLCKEKHHYHQENSVTWCKMPKTHGTVALSSSLQSSTPGSLPSAPFWHSLLVCQAPPPALAPQTPSFPASCLGALRGTVADVSGCEWGCYPGLNPWL